MKIIGIVGGLGPEASLYYYRVLIDLAHQKQKTKYPELECVIYNVNQEETGAKLFTAGKWNEHADRLLDTINRLQRAGADFAIIACNTSHTVFNQVKDKSPLPLLSIVEETAKEIARRGLSRVGLFGSPDTLKGRYYPDVLIKYNISIVTPTPEEQIYIGSKVREELVLGILREETRESFLKIAQRMIDDDKIQGLILGCTEIPLLLTEEVLSIPFFNTSKIHAESAFRYANE